MSCWSLTAVRLNSSCKTRLSGCLSLQSRMGLVSAMLGHVISVLGEVEGVDQVAVVSPERTALPESVFFVDDPGGGLNEALAAAALEARRNGADRLLIVHADLPLLRADEVAALVEASRVAEVAIAPDRGESGTNALCLTWQSRLRFEFGPGSFVRHMSQMAGRGISPAVVRLPGLAFDLDEPADLRCWSGKGQEVSLA